MSRQRTMLFSRDQGRALLRQSAERRKGADKIKIERAPLACLLIDISKLGGVGDDISDTEVLEAYRMIDKDRGEHRQIRADLLERLIRRWWKQTEEMA